MFIGEFDFNKSALQEFRNFCALPQYHAAYHTTNEPIEQWLPLTPIKNPRVLTVAASGDQALMYAACGASHVDTFDITVNACAMMDFKTTALQYMSYTQYANTIKLFETWMGYVTPYTRKRISAVIKQMPNRTRDLMTQITKNPVQALQYMDDKPLFPDNANLYSEMRRKVHAPFNFIWSDLMNVTNYIHAKYDIINLSNIFDHYIWYQKKSLITIYRTIHKLWPYLNKDGYILCSTRHQKYINLAQNIKHISRLLPTQAHVILSTPDNQLKWHAIVIQKIR